MRRSHEKKESKRFSSEARKSEKFNEIRREKGKTDSLRLCFVKIFIGLCLIIAACAVGGYSFHRYRGPPSSERKAVFGTLSG